MLEALRCTPSAHLRNDKCSFSEDSRLILVVSLVGTGESLERHFASVLTIGQVAAQIGAPYNTMGLMRESKSVERALNDSLVL